MPDPNAVVSTVVRLDPPLDRPATELLRDEPGLFVELQDGRRVRLDAADPRSPGFAQILAGLSQQRLPVYLEIDPATSAIARLLIPHVARVVNVRPRDGGGLEVELEPSHARHRLPAGAADFAELENQLREAMRSGEAVIVTEDDAHHIIEGLDSSEHALARKHQEQPRVLRRLGLARGAHPVRARKLLLSDAGDGDWPVAVH